MNSFRKVVWGAVTLLAAVSCKSQYDTLLSSNDVDAKYKAAFQYFDKGKYQNDTCGTGENGKNYQNKIHMLNFIIQQKRLSFNNNLLIQPHRFIMCSFFKAPAC